MAWIRSPPWFLLDLTTLLLTAVVASSLDANGESQVYIVYMGERPSETYLAKSLHLDILDQVLERSSPRDSLLYSYGRSFNGFAAKLTDQEQQKLARMEGIVSVFPSRTLKIRTTRSWNFLGFPETVKRNLPLERDVIVGMLDTGIWPDSKSFSDVGYGPPPSRWNGVCQNITCNNKIIGARYYNAIGYFEGAEPSPRDFEGHGSHTASTVAGSTVENASLYGLAHGNARGAVPSARIAVYKVCWLDGCMDHDILAAFDDAIADGVDVISLSISPGSVRNYFEDSIAIGSFHAMKKGVLTSAAGGNAGPARGTVSNVAPWMLVAAASTMDRRIRDKLVLGNQRSFLGVSINTFPTEERLYPLVSASNGAFPQSDCTIDVLNKDLVKGKIVLCGSIDDGTGLMQYGAHGSIMVDDFFLGSAFAFPIPALVVSTSDGNKLRQYVNRTRNPMANIHKSESVFDTKAPLVASFSSRGPNTITPDIMKPDLSAPGVEILAAWSSLAPMSSVYANDTRNVKYNIISGTSMACPHITGAAAYVKSFNPKWSPSSIMSALMTTATPMKASRHPDAELAYGAGQLNVMKAVHPGLVYNATAGDYVRMLCNQGYNTTLIRLVTGGKISCPKDPKGTVRDLNYASMAIYVKDNKTFLGKFTRTVTNVGLAGSRYKSKISSDPKLNVTVRPRVLSFTSLNMKSRFAVMVSGGPLPKNSIASASITWTDGKHTVRSPIIVYTS